MELKDWWESGVGRNSYTEFTTRTGQLSVYVRRNAINASVMEIANVSTISGFGASRVLYGSFTRDIPCLAENILNPQLDVALEKWGWDFAYRDLGGIPTRINHAFKKRFANYAEAHSAFCAVTRP